MDIILWFALTNLPWPCLCSSAANSATSWLFIIIIYKPYLGGAEQSYDIPIVQVGLYYYEYIERYANAKRSVIPLPLYKNGQYNLPDDLRWPTMTLPYKVPRLLTALVWLTPHIPLHTSIPTSWWISSRYYRPLVVYIYMYLPPVMYICIYI